MLIKTEHAEHAPLQPRTATANITPAASQASPASQASHAAPAHAAPAHAAPAAPASRTTPWKLRATWTR